MSTYFENLTIKLHDFYTFLTHMSNFIKYDIIYYLIYKLIFYVKFYITKLEI